MTLVKHTKKPNQEKSLTQNELQKIPLFPGSKWQSHRKMIAPTFHINILKSFVGVFNQNSMSVVEKMRSETGKTFDVHDYMSTATVDILLGKEL